MNYMLVVLTHGAGETLARTMASFEKHVSPGPSSQHLHADIGGKGFCKSVKTCWDMARDGDHTHVFWLEHDFLFLRPVNLETMARTMAAANMGGAKLAQMALPRQPLNDRELEEGLIAPGDCCQHHSWRQHSQYFTTNPSLIPVATVRDNDWPVRTECEGHFGIHLLERGYSFGMWGKDGEQWVSHVGVRTGKGY